MHISNIEYSLNTYNHILMVLSDVPYLMKEKFRMHAIALSISLNVYLLHEKIPVRFVGAQQKVLLVKVWLFEFMVYLQYKNWVIDKWEINMR